MGYDNETTFSRSVRALRAHGTAAGLGGLAILIGLTTVVLVTTVAPGAQLLGMAGLLTAAIGSISFFYIANVSQRELLFTSKLRDLGSRIARGDHENQLGLVEVFSESTDVDYSNLLRTSKKLFLIMNDGRAWTLRHRSLLASRIKDPARETVFFLLHPQSPLLAVHAKKAGADVDFMKAKIAETLGILEQERTADSNLSVYGHFLYNTYSACIGDDEAIVSNYFISRGSRRTPAFRYVDMGRRCMFEDLLNDIEILMLDSSHLGSGGTDRQPISIFTRRRSA